MDALWHNDGLVLLGLIVIGALWPLWHLMLALRLLRCSTLGEGLRRWAWLPPLTPIAAYLAGMRLRAVLWCVLALAYLVLRTQA